MQQQLILTARCYATCKAGQWTAVCVDLSLAAQSDSLGDAKRRLDKQISAYMLDALLREDRHYAHQLLRRTAPLSQIARYYWLSACAFLNPFDAGNRRWKTVWPLFSVLQ